MALVEYMPKVELRAATVSLGVSVSLLAIKFIAYHLTKSAAVFSDAVESIANVLAAGAAFYSLMVAHWPADAQHPYGHGKVEFLSAGFEGSLILLAAVFIVARTILGLVQGHWLQEEQLDVGLLLMIFAMLTNGGVGLYLIRTGRRQRSVTLLADGKHLVSDAYTSIGVLAALGVVWLTGWVWADPIGALAVAGYIGWMGIELLRGAGAGLMDKQDLEDEQLLRRLLDAHVGREGKEPRICTYHKLRHRHSGRYHWVDFHIMVPSHFSVDQGHAIASAIEYEIEQALGEGNATAHVEPCHDRPCILGSGPAKGLGSPATAEQKDGGQGQKGQGSGFRNRDQGC
ncbi:MAG TPA: cation diffusion facilitator family transporter [Tepidisphaeraceae bacterium]|nr:cation diffusion facilitator family transporter [Tepidisphaeraceae bacterium]